MSLQSIKSQLLQQYARSNSITLELAVAHEPRDNGFAERRNRTLLEGAHALMHGKNLSLTYWPYAMEYATYLQNRLGRPQSGLKSPYEIAFGVKPDLSDAFLFGSKVWVHTATAQTGHFTPKSVVGTVVGISGESNGYRVIIGNQISVHRNVVFSTDTIATPVMSSSNVAPEDSSLREVSIPIPVFIPRPVAPPAISLPIPSGQLGLGKARKSPLSEYWARARSEELRKLFDLGVFVNRSN